jgi:choline monooxygenase
MTIQSPGAADLPDDFHLAVDRPVAEAKGMPNAAYTSQAYFESERDQLFGKTWAVVGVGIDIPEPGDVKPVSFMGLPLVLVRDRAGEVRVFHNVCSHRGLELVAAPCKVKLLIQCPYHSWTYDLTGKLRSTPMIGGPGENDCAGFEKARHGLKAVRSAVWLDMIFVNLSGDAPNFDDFIAPFTRRWADYDLDRVVHGGSDSSWRLELNCNWKLAVENHCDAYHLPWVHPELNRVSRLEDHYEILGPEGFYAGQGSHAYLARRPEGAPILPLFPGLEGAQTTGAEYISLFPNATIGLHSDHLWTVWFDPIHPDRTGERMELYYTDAAVRGDDFTAVRREVHRFWYNVWSEDQWAVEGMQRGRSSPAFQGGVFSPVVDRPTHHFHRWVARSLAGTPLA